LPVVGLVGESGGGEEESACGKLAEWVWWVGIVSMVVHGIGMDGQGTGCTGVPFCTCARALSGLVMCGFAVGRCLSAMVVLRV